MNKGIMTGHPRITVEHRVDGPVVVRDRSASEEVTRNVRYTALIVGVLGIALLYFAYRSALDREQFDWPMIIGLAGFGVLLVFAIAWLVLSPRQQTEFRLTDDVLSARDSPFSVGGGLSLARGQIDHLQIEHDRSGYRVQAVCTSGFGVIHSQSGFVGIATQDEATALASTLAQQFNLKMEHGLRPPVPLPQPPTEEKQTARYLNPPPVPPPATTVRVESSDAGLVVIYRPDSGARDQATGGAVLAGLGALGLVAALALDYVTVRPFTLIVLLGLVGVFYSSVVTAFNQVEFTVQDGGLHRRDRPVPYPFTGFPYTLAELDGIGVFVHWDNYNTVHYRVVAHYTFGNEVSLLSEIPADDGHALCQALNKTFGIPLISTK